MNNQDTNQDTIQNTTQASRTITVYRTEVHRIKKNHHMFNLFSDLTFKAKNIYNLTLYNQRQTYFQYKKFLNYMQAIELLKDTPAFKDLPPVLSQQVIKQATETCTSFMKASIEHTKNLDKFKARPKIPKYKHKTEGRYTISFTNQASRIKFNLTTKKNEVHFHKILNQFTLPTKAPLNSLQQVQIVPRHQEFEIHIKYTKQLQIQHTPDTKFIAGIDLGLNNFSAITVWNNFTKPLLINGKGIKSYNTYFNKKLAYLQSQATKQTKDSKTYKPTHQINRLL